MARFGRRFPVPTYTGVTRGWGGSAGFYGIIYGTPGESTHRQYELLIFDCDASPAVVDWQIRSRFPNATQGVGSMVLGTATAQFWITAVGGGQADSTAVEDGDLHLEVNQGAPEDAVYDAGTNTLTATLDIAGGNDTVADLRAVIDAAGDFYTSSDTGDSETISASETGDAAMTGATDTPAGDLAVADPRIHDSSDRFFYLLDFPLRIRKLVGARWTCCFQQASFSYPRSWRVSHTGENEAPDFISPIGAGNDPAQRTEFFTGAFGSTFSSVKNSATIDLSPALEEL